MIYFFISSCQYKWFGNGRTRGVLAWGGREMGCWNGGVTFACVRAHIAMANKMGTSFREVFSLVRNGVFTSATEVLSTTTYPLENRLLSVRSGECY